MGISEADGKLVVSLVDVAIKAGSVRDEGVFLQVLDLKRRIITHFSPKPEDKELELVKDPV